MTDLGVLRLIVNDPERCLSVLKENDFAAQATEVVAVDSGQARRAARRPEDP